MTKDEALDLALEALEKSIGMLERADCSTGYCCCGSSVDGHTFGDGHSPVDEGEYYQSNALEYARKAITAIKQARSAPVQEPLASAAYDMVDRFLRNNLSSDADYAEYSAALDALYTTPPAAQRQWVGLTAEERTEIAGFAAISDWHDFEVIDAVETKLKEKNT